MRYAAWFLLICDSLAGARQALYMMAAVLCSVPEGFVPEQEDGRAVLEVKKKVPPSPSVVMREILLPKGEEKHCPCHHVKNCVE